MREDHSFTLCPTRRSGELWFYARLRQVHKQKGYAASDGSQSNEPNRAVQFSIDVQRNAFCRSTFVTGTNCLSDDRQRRRVPPLGPLLPCLHKSSK